jgi:hypothetical protein
MHLRRAELLRLRGCRELDANLFSCANGLQNVSSCELLLCNLSLRWPEPIPLRPLFTLLEHHLLLKMRPRSRSRSMWQRLP